MIRTAVWVVVLALFSAPPAAAGGWFTSLAADDTSREGQHRTRNARAMVDAVAALPAEDRPSRILYLASGAHLAPLALCGFAPEGQPCQLVFTEVDADVGTDIHDALVVAARAGRIADLESVPDGEDAPPTSWTFTAADRSIGLELRVRPEADNLIIAEDLRDADLVINHDWSGEPLGNLRVIDEFLEAVHAAGLDTPPMLMIEDLEAHPFPIDLAILTPVARSRGLYGHRTGDGGVGMHATVELGPSLFGGAVILDFGDPWWRGLESDQRRAVLDLLSLSGFDDRRRNVLEGGPTPMVPPLVLDWWTGFGERTLSTDEVNASPGTRRRAISTAAALRSDSAPGRTAHLNRLLATYRALLMALAVGADADELWPDHAGFRTLDPSAFPTDAMRQAQREALRHIREFRPTREHALQMAAPALEALQALDPPVPDSCPKPAPDTPDPKTAWANHYRCLVEKDPN
jgi:hypothetical protein